MRVLLVLACLTILLAPGEADARKRQRGRERPTPISEIVIEDRSGAAWSPVVAAMVEEFAAAAPHLRLRYERGAGECTPVRGRVVVCEGDMGSVVAGTIVTYRLVTLGPIDRFPLPTPANVVCHELMHALTGISDNQGSREDSCVWGYLETPGAFDLTWLERPLPIVEAPSRQHRHRRH
jgi:hypothetical protein